MTKTLKTALQASETVRREENRTTASEASSDKVKLNSDAGRDFIKALSEAQSPEETTAVGQMPIPGSVCEDLVKPQPLEKLALPQIDSLRIFSTPPLAPPIPRLGTRLPEFPVTLRTCRHRMPYYGPSSIA